MQNFDNVFAKEFRDMMNGRRSMVGNFNLVDLPLPELNSVLTNFTKGKVCLIKGIKEPFFEKLNKTEVQLVGKTTLLKRQVLSNGQFRRDSENNFVYTQISVKTGFVAIHSPKSIGLKRYIEVNGKQKEHKPTEGFRYVDYFELNGEKRYIYIVPKENVYPLELCALIITPNKHRVYYKGCRLALQNGNYVYLYVIPYKVKENPGYRVIGAKASPNFDEEVKKILQYWTQLGVMFDLRLTALENQVGGQTNVGIMDLVGTCGIDDYQKIGHSLANSETEIE